MIRNGIIVAAVTALFLPSAHSQKLTGTGAAGNAAQGSAVAISTDGSTILAGGPADNGGAGAAWFFTLKNGAWTQQGGKIIGADLSGAAAFGTAVALSGDGSTAIIGAPGDNSKLGAALVFTRSGGLWMEQAKLAGNDAVPTNGAVNLGCSVALSGDGNTALVGGSKDNSAAGGATWVFTRTAGVWTQQGPKLVASDAARGGMIGFPQDSPVDQGTSVAISSDGNTAVVGGPYDSFYYDDSGHTGGGAVWVFVRSVGVWTQQGPKIVGDNRLLSFAGTEVAVSGDGNTLAEVSSRPYGLTCVFVRNAGVWSAQGGQLPTDGSAALSPNGNTALLGDPAAGAARIYGRYGGVWTQIKELVGAPSIGQSMEGSAVALSGDGTLAVLGGPGDSSGAGAVFVIAVPAAPGPAAPYSVTPASGVAANVPMSFVFAGVSNIGVANILINNFLDGRTACYLAYVAPQNVLYLVGDSGGGLLPGNVLTGPGSTSNSQCTVSWGSAPVSNDGNFLVLTLSIAFSPSFAGDKVIYVAAGNTAGSNSGWQAMGVTNVAGAGNPALDASMSPGSGKGPIQTFTFNFIDSKGYQDLGVLDILLNDSLDGRHACYLAYVPRTNMIYLVNDSGDALLPGLALGTVGGGLSNNQCRVGWSATPVSTSFKSLSLTLAMAFGPNYVGGSFAGNRIFYLAARDVTEANN